MAVGDEGTPCPRNQIMEVFDKWVSFIRTLRYWSSRYPTDKGTYEDKMWMMLCGGLIWLQSHGYRMATHNDKQLVEEDIPTILDESPVNIDLQLLYYQRFFITRKEYMGLVALDTKVRDTVYVLVGGNILYILRRRGGRPDDHRFSFISAALVHRIMQGGLLPKEEEL